jgi:hypothetical protein
MTIFIGLGIFCVSYLLGSFVTTTKTYVSGYSKGIDDCEAVIKKLMEKEINDKAIK